MKNLETLKHLKHLKLPNFHLDGFQKNIKENIYLEFFLKKSRVLITPNHQYYFTGHAEEEELIQVEALIKEKDLFENIKEFIICNLALYSALIETNSYYIENNLNSIICRLVPQNQSKDHFELKVYTIHPDELPENYKDKIYLGRDFVNITSLHRDYLGLNSIVNSLREQIKKLEKRLMNYIPREIFSEIQSEYLIEIKELIEEFAELSLEITDNYPKEISKKKLKENQLIEINKTFRNLKHILIDIEETISELDEKLIQYVLNQANKYVIKFKKDITNYIHYILIKVNGRISDSLNHIHI